MGNDFKSKEDYKAFVEAMGKKGYSANQVNEKLKSEGYTVEGKDISTVLAEMAKPQGTYDTSDSFDELTGNVDTVADDDYQLLTNDESKEMYGNLSTQGNATHGGNFNPSSLYPSIKALGNVKVNTPIDLANKQGQIIEKKAIKELTKKEAKNVAKNTVKVAKDYIKRGGKKIAELVGKVGLERAVLIIGQLYEGYRTLKDTEQGWVKSEVAEEGYGEGRGTRDSLRTFYAYMDNTLFGLLPNIDAVYNKGAGDGLYGGITANYEQQKQAEKIAENKQINKDYKTSKKYWKEVDKAGDDQAVGNSEIQYLINTGKSKEGGFTPEDRQKLSKLFDWKEVPLKDGSTRKDRVYVGKNKSLQGRTLTELGARGITRDKIQ